MPSSLPPRPILKPRISRPGHDRLDGRAMQWTKRLSRLVSRDEAVPSAAIFHIDTYPLADTAASRDPSVSYRT